MVRDKYKNIEYFKSQFERLEKVIARRESTEYRKKVSPLRKKNYQSSQSSYFSDIFSVSYVLRAEKKDLFNYFQKSFHYFAQSYGEGEGIADIIDYLSLAILFDEHKGEIISRKATDLDQIQEETFRAYLSEFEEKYSRGTKIRSNTNRFIDGMELEGEYILEIPASNKDISNIRYYEDIASEYGVKLRYTEE